MFYFGVDALGRILLKKNWARETTETAVLVKLRKGQGKDAKRNKTGYHKEHMFPFVTWAVTKRNCYQKERYKKDKASYHREHSSLV